MSSLLRSLFEQSLLESLRSLQKVVHTHPGYLWAWPMIPYIMIVMGGKSPALISSYLQLVHSKGQFYCMVDTIIMFMPKVLLCIYFLFKIIFCKVTPLAGKIVLETYSPKFCANPLLIAANSRNTCIAIFLLVIHCTEAFTFE